MEKAAHNLSEKIALHMNFDIEKKAVIEYGLLAIFNILVIGLVISLAGLLFHFWYESIILFIGVGILKKSTGGAHAQTMAGCVIISVLSITFFAAASRYIFDHAINVYINIGITILVLVLSFIVFYKLVPVDTANKPINKPEKIKRLRRQSFIILGLYAALSLFSAMIAPTNHRFYSITFCIRFVLLWQTFMLTMLGQRFISFIDSKFNIKEVN